MSLIGCDTTLDERWNADRPECMADFCNQCGDCLGCFATFTCAEAEEPAAGRHEWLNEAGEVKFV